MGWDDEKARAQKRADFLNHVVSSREKGEPLPGIPEDHKVLEVYGKPRKIPAHYFQSKANVVLLCLWVLDDPAVDNVLVAAGFEVKDVEGTTLFPRDPLERLADVMDADLQKLIPPGGFPPIKAEAEIGSSWARPGEQRRPLAVPSFVDLQCARDGCAEERRKKSKYCSLKCSNRNAQARWLERKRKGGG